jgi:hypothetical protein
MIRGILSILLVMPGFPSLEAPIPPKQDDFPSVSVVLSANVPSETVQISYFLIGPFGGYGTYTKQQTGLHSYQISSLVEGKPAREIRMIIYAAGCEIKTFVLPLEEDSRVEQEFECQPAASVQLSGQIMPAELTRRDNAELVVHYMAYWAHGFFGIADGMVTEFQVATVSPDANGVFQVKLPYFCAAAPGSSPQPRATFRLMLRDSKTWNHIASNLEPEMSELRPEDHGLQILSHYPDGLKFTSGTL